jgi:hypothetical protein
VTFLQEREKYINELAEESEADAQVRWNKGHARRARLIPRVA